MKKKDTSSVQVIAAVSAVSDQYKLCMAKEDSADGLYDIFEFISCR